jgi:antitoxin (DNA-binding transcriptional repressor) of toxin-antitoxin stability system
MKKFNARQFQKQFGRIADSLKPGETIEVTRRGKAVGKFTKTPQKIKMPDFMALLERHSCPQAVGDQILKKFTASLS